MKVPEHVSGKKILTWFRNRTTTMKQTIRMLCQAQEGLLSGFAALGILAAKLETSSSGTVKIQEENLVRETMEQQWFILYECKRAYGTPIPEIRETLDESSSSP